MEETKIKESAQPYAEEANEVAPSADTTPQKCENENSQVKIPIKFNKQTRILTAEEAASLAQKGLKYERLQGDIELLRSLAAEKGKNIGDYLSDLKAEHLKEDRAALIERVGGDTALADEIITLKGKASSELLGLEELKSKVEEIKSLEDIPESVLSAARDRGSNVFDEYLRYTFEQNRKAGNAEEKSREAAYGAVGSQASPAASLNSGDEFIKGLWNRN